MKKVAVTWLVPTVVVVVSIAGCSAVLSPGTVPRTFQPAQPIAPQDFSHQAFDAVLHVHVDDGDVNYPAILRDPRFEAYLGQLNHVNPKQLPSRADRLAFWINAYNAFAIKGILDGYSPRTLFGRYRYFISRDYAVGGAAINLYDLEQKLLIPDFGEPRIHFAIVCASQSCPKLSSRAYTADKLEEQLEQGARGFVNDTRKNRFDREQKIASLSKIFKWFEKDFAAHSGSLLEYVKQYVNDPELVLDMEGSPYRVEFLEYDWRLNGIPPEKEARSARQS